ncbi:MAG: ABC transporter substrate-binding protein, partial [Candidatus Dormibacteraeota bacterium]|nr:ABC transporter substrate-binding protein [Candidatus Dormibacteraeota bacterium]
AQVGGEALNPEDTSLPTAFPLDGGIVTQVIGDVIGIKARGLHSLFVVTLDTPSGQLTAALAAQAARAVGIQMLGVAYAPQAAADFTPYVQAAQQSHADVVWPALLEPWLGQFLAASKTVGAKYVITAAYGAWSPRDIAELGGAHSPTEGSIEFGPVPPVTATAEFPALRTFKSDLDAEWAAGDKDAAPDLRSGGPLMAWVAVEAIAKVASTLPSVDSASLLKALRTSPQVDTLGLTPPWTPGRTGPPAFPRVTNPFGYLTTQQDGVQTLVNPQPINISAGLAG